MYHVYKEMFGRPSGRSFHFYNPRVIIVRKEYNAMRIKLPKYVAEKLIGTSKKDLRVQFFSASGKGGQHRNKTDTACRMTHIATGISAESTDSRSQS